MSDQGGQLNATSGLAPLGLGGVSSGDFFGAILQELGTLKLQSGGDREKVVQVLIARLHDQGLITPHDVERLQALSTVVFAKTRGELGAAEFAGRVRSAHRATLTDSDSSEVARSIMSVLSEVSVSSALGEVNPREAQPGMPPAAEGQAPNSDPLAGEGATSSLPASDDAPTMIVDEGIILEGAMLGAGIGGLLGGPVGGVVGGTLGTIVGGFVAVFEAIF